MRDIKLDILLLVKIISTHGTNMYKAGKCLKTILHIYISFPEKSPLIPLEHFWGFQFKVDHVFLN